MGLLPAGQLQGTDRMSLLIFEETGNDRITDPIPYGNILAKTVETEEN